MTFKETCKQKVETVKKIEKQFYGYPIHKNDKKTAAKRKELEKQLKEAYYNLS